MLILSVVLTLSLLVSGCQLFRVQQAERKSTLKARRETVKEKIKETIKARRAKIVFAADGDIWTVNENGGGLTQLTNTPEVEKSPDFSPDGSKIVYAKGGGGNAATPEGYVDLWIMNADGTDQRLLADAGFEIDNPRFSPDGQKVAFDCRSAMEPDWGNGEIWVVNADGTGARRLTAPNAVAESAPQWSPNGAKIAYETSGEVFCHIWVMNADGTDQHALVTQVASGSLSPATILTEPHWSPDGSMIAFAADWGGIDAHSDIIKKIAIAGLDGRVITIVDARRGGDFTNHFAGWSADSSRMFIVATHENENSSRDFNYDLWSYQISGGLYRQLTGDGRIRNHVLNAQSPDFRKVAFVEWSDEPTATDFIRKYHTLWIINLNGTNLKKLVKDKEFGYCSPSWSQ